MLHTIYPLAAIGYSIIYLLFGGGLGSTGRHLHHRQNARQVTGMMVTVIH